MFKKIIKSSVFVLAMVVVSNAAYIDFTNSAFSGINSAAITNTYTVTNYQNTGIGVTLISDPTNSNLTWNTLASGHDANDGIGINDDEITGGTLERLHVNFINGPVSISRIDITDLFIEGNNQAEIGLVFVDGTTNMYSFLGNSTGNNGAISLTGLNFTNVAGLTFFAPANLRNTKDLTFNDFSVRGIEVTANVPEPGMLSLFGIGILAISSLRFVRKRKQ